MNAVIQVWKSRNIEIADENTIKTRINRLLQDADKLVKSTRDMKKPKFIADKQAKFDVVFDIAKSPVKNAPVRAGPSKETRENHDDSTVNVFLVSPLK